MGAITDLIQRMTEQGVAHVAPAENRQATPDPTQTLGIARVARVAPKKNDLHQTRRYPSVWRVRVSGKSLTMIDFAHEPKAVIEQQLRARFGGRLEHFERKEPPSCGS